MSKVSSISRKNDPSTSLQTDSTNSVSTTWKTRNDSKSVSAIINPVIGDDALTEYDIKTTSVTPRQTTKRIQLESRGNSPRPPWDGPCKECYCHKERVPPALFQAPSKCLKDKKYERRCQIHEDLSTKYIDRDKTICNHELLHKAKQLINYQPKSTFLKNLQKEIEQNCHCISPRSSSDVQLHFTESRANYENNRPLSCYEKDYSKELDKYKASDAEEATSLTFTNAAKNSNVDGKDAKPSSGNIEIAQEDKGNIERQGSSSGLLKEFRDKNFFECCSTATNKIDYPDHKCLHKFTITDRLYALPLNSDPYGVSRCAICNLPVDDNKEKGVQTSRPSDLCNLTTRYRNNLMPRHINITTRNQKIQVQLPNERLAKELFALRLPPYNCQPLNSYALRYQKGVMK